jgi:hypothetical protein
MNGPDTLTDLLILVGVIIVIIVLHISVAGSALSVLHQVRTVAGVLRGPIPLIAGLRSSVHAVAASHSRRAACFSAALERIPFEGNQKGIPEGWQI